MLGKGSFYETFDLKAAPSRYPGCYIYDMPKRDG